MIAAALIPLISFAGAAFAVFEGSFEGNNLAGPARQINYTECPVITLPAGGRIKLNKTHVITLHDQAQYLPNCTSYLQENDPFYGSTTVFVFVVGITTVMAWMLLILLLINQSDSRARRTPNTTSWLRAHTISGAMFGNTSLGGLGNRPWLQKAAVFLVAIGLTVASVDTFQNAEMQHQLGWNSARSMRIAVVQSYEIRVLRVVSGIFVWLALVQTLIRLFPRRKEKLIIKWFSFALIFLDTVFSCLNMFWLTKRTFPASSEDAISALAYLFQLSINLLYAAWVSYYVATQRRFAFFRPDQLNMSIVAALALISMAIPVAFFIADISVPPVSAWGDFFRWVGGAAASVVVWEWVERIEALEREEKKDGILGREVFDEDELSSSGNSTSGTGSFSSSDGTMAKHKHKRPSHLFADVTRRLGLKPAPRAHVQPKHTGLTFFEPDVEKEPQRTGASQTRPDPPGSQDGTASPGSTIYAVHYHPVQSTPPALEPGMQLAARENAHHHAHAQNGLESYSDTNAVNLSQSSQKQHNDIPATPGPAKLVATTRSGWTLAANVFKRRKRSPPLEIKKAMQRSGASLGQSRPTPPRLNFKSRIYMFGLSKGNTAKPDDGTGEKANKQPTVIPAPPRGQTWSPDILRHSPVHLLQNTAHSFTPTSHAHPALPYRTTVEQSGQTPAHQQDIAQTGQVPFNSINVESETREQAFQDQSVASEGTNYVEKPSEEENEGGGGGGGGGGEGEAAAATAAAVQPRLTQDVQATDRPPSTSVPTEEDKG